MKYFIAATYQECKDAKELYRKLNNLSGSTAVLDMIHQVFVMARVNKDQEVREVLKICRSYGECKIKISRSP